MNEEDDLEYKFPKRTKQHDPDKEEREKAQIKAGEVYSAWRGQFVNTVAREGGEVIGRLLVLRTLISEGITHEEVREMHLKMIDHSLKEARKKWPDTSPKGKRAASRAGWSASAAAKDRTRGGTGRSRRKPPGPAEPGDTGNSARN